MAAAKGNKYAVGADNGRPKAIPTAEAMQQHFEAYVKTTKENPIKVQDYVGKDAEKVDRDKERPLTMEGFENYLFKAGIISDASDYFENKENRYQDFIHICRAIKRLIRQDQIEGGMVGIYNPSITQRLNNINDRLEVDGNMAHSVAPELIQSLAERLNGNATQPNEGE